MKEYIKESRNILKQLGIWEYMSYTEKKSFNSKETEIAIDNMKRSMIIKYL